MHRYFSQNVFLLLLGEDKSFLKNFLLQSFHYVFLMTLFINNLPPFNVFHFGVTNKSIKQKEMLKYKQLL